MKTVTVLKKDYVCFIKHKLNWDRKKVHKLLFMLWHIFHGKQLLVWHLTTKHTKCGLQSCTFLLLYLTCGKVKGSCWIVRKGDGADSCDSSRKQLYDCLQFYQCSSQKRNLLTSERLTACMWAVTHSIATEVDSSVDIWHLTLKKWLMYKNVCTLSDGPHLPNPCLGLYQERTTHGMRFWSVLSKFIYVFLA